MANSYTRLLDKYEKQKEETAQYKAFFALTCNRVEELRKDVASGEIDIFVAVDCFLAALNLYERSTNERLELLKKGG